MTTVLNVINSERDTSKFEMAVAAGYEDPPFLLLQACSFFSSESTIDESEA